MMRIANLVGESLFACALVPACCPLGIHTAIAGPRTTPTYTTFDVPGSIGTYPESMNKSGAITGYYNTDDNQNSHGFVRAGDGTITSFDPPGSSVTYALSINDNGVIVGYSPDTGGFVRTPDGTITTITDPKFPGKGTIARSINDKGVITGCIGVGGGEKGFVRGPDGRFTPWKIPGSVDFCGMSINDVGTVAGYYCAFDCTQSPAQGFLRTADGRITTFPSNAYTGDFYSINNKNVITGSYADYSSQIHGYVRAADGTITIFDPNGSLNTNPLSINDKGTITGYFIDKRGLGRGFLRAADGTIIGFDAPVSYISSTTPTSINDNNDITGYYSGVHRVHGFLRMP